MSRRVPHSPRREPERGEAGFTLVELLVALLIFGMLSAAGVALLSFSVRAQEAAQESMESLGDVRRAGALLIGDLAQAAPRLVRDINGAPQPAFVGGSGQGNALLFSLVRRGWEVTGDSRRPALQKVEYRLAGDRLERVAYRFLDGAQPMGSIAVLEGVRGVRLRYRDAEGRWRELWDPLDPTLLPKAVELTVETETSGQIRQLFLVGSGA